MTKKKATANEILRIDSPGAFQAPGQSTTLTSESVPQIARPYEQFERNMAQHALIVKVGYGRLMNSGQERKASGVSGKELAGSSQRTVQELRVG